MEYPGMPAPCVRHMRSVDPMIRKEKAYYAPPNGATPMEFKVLEKEKNALKLEIEGPDDTVIYPLINELLKDEDVAEAKYFVGHPQLDKPVLYVRTKKGKPQAAIKKAADGLAGQFREARALFASELK